MLKVGDRIVIPGVQPGAPVAPRAQAQVAPPMPVQRLATAESPHSARVATPKRPRRRAPIKTAEPAGGLPSFRWPVHGRVIAGFGPKPNGQQNDGINVSVPEGTPVKAAEDGVVAYAGNELKGYGNLVLVRHSNGFVTAYAHASEDPGQARRSGEARPGDREVRPDRQRDVAATALRDPQGLRRRSIRRNI